MHVTVLLFGALRESLGTRELGVELEPGATVAELRAQLARRHPSVATYGARLRVALNREFAGDGTRLSDGDELALLPPVSGGAGLCSLSETQLDPSAVTARVSGPDAGGVVVFVGAVREHSRGREIRHLEYEAYPEMALREVERICDAATGRWPGVRVAIAHRTGRLEIGDAAVVVAAAAPHRAEAFDACRFAIDALKQTVPIWKKEVAADGEAWVDDHP